MDIDIELARDVANILDRTVFEAREIIAAAHPLWRALEPSVDGYLGAEFHRVFPEAIRTIYREANPIAAEARGV